MDLVHSLLATPAGFCKICKCAKCGDVTGGECNNRSRCNFTTGGQAYSSGSKCVLHIITMLRGEYMMCKT